MSGPTGSALLARARALEAANALHGCQDAITSTHSAGRAAGFSDCVNWLESLSRVTGDQVTNDEPPPEGETESLETLSP